MFGKRKRLIGAISGFLLISGCSPSSPVSNDVSPSESGESPQALSEESWPTFGRQEMDSVDVDVERT